MAAVAFALAAGCPPATPGPQPPIGTSGPRQDDAGTARVEDEADGMSPGPEENAAAGRIEREVSDGPLAPCMTAAAVAAWAEGAGAETVAAALARHLTDLTVEGAPEVTAEQAAAAIVALRAAPLADPVCASLLVTYGFDAERSGDAATPPATGRAVAVFGTALTEPAVAWGACEGAGETCAILATDDVDGDGAGDLLIERTVVGSGLPARLILYAFREGSDPFPVWISDDDVVRRALFGEDGDADPENRAEAANVIFGFEEGVPTIRVDYRLFSCPEATATDTDPDACDPRGAETLAFTRLGDVYVLPGEPEPGAPWGRPEDAEPAAGSPQPAQPQP